MKSISKSKKTVVSCQLSVVSFVASRQEGFGLLEAMVGIFIMITGVVGAMILVSAGVNNMGASKSRLIAVNLAQEGLEIVHNIRDTNWLESSFAAWNDWNGDTLSDSCSPCSKYVNWDSVDLVGWPEPAGGLMWDDDNSVKHYVYSPITPIGESFSRKIVITDLGDLTIPPDGTNDYSKVQVIVGWGPAGVCNEAGITIDRRFCLTLEERLYDWLD